MLSLRGNDEERFERIEHLIEEYRVNREDLEAYVNKVCAEAKVRHLQSQHTVQEPATTSLTPSAENAERYFC